MKYFFPQIDTLSLNNSLVNTEDYFRGANTSGLIEYQLNENQTAVRIYANGAPCSAYELENSGSKSVPWVQAVSLNNEINLLRAIELPDVAGRLTWLALESQANIKYSVQGSSNWITQLTQWKKDQWDGLIEISADNLYGFALFLHGELQKTDVIFFTDQGLVSDLPRMESTNDPVWEITTYSYVLSTQAYQCAVMRTAAMHWGRQILSRYRELVGYKLLNMIGRDLNRQIQPWRWNIEFEENNMFDRHFFIYLSDAVHAYRALFMAMGAQMNIVIGNNLTQMLLNETFDQIHPEERAILKSQRLIPAAFTE